MWLSNIVFLLSVKFGFTFDIPTKCISDIKINNERYNVTNTYHLDDQAIPTDAHYDVYGNLFYVESLRSDDDGYRFNIFVVKARTAAPQKIAGKNIGLSWVRRHFLFHIESPSSIVTFVMFFFYYPLFPGLPEGLSYSIAVDIKKSKVYFGTGKGMYTYDYDSDNAVPLTNSSLKLDMIFVDKNSNKYIIENIDGIEEFYFLDGETKIRCDSLEALNEMAIDNENNFYFIREEKLFVLKSRHETPTCIGDVNYNGNAQISFYDRYVFVASDYLSYFHQNDTGNLKLVDNIPGNVTAIAFECDGEFILGLQGKIVKYKKNYCYLRKNRVVDERESSFV